MVCRWRCRVRPGLEYAGQPRNTIPDNGDDALGSVVFVASNVGGKLKWESATNPINAEQQRNTWPNNEHPGKANGWVPGQNPGGASNQLYVRMKNLDGGDGNYRVYFNVNLIPQSGGRPAARCHERRAAEPAPGDGQEAARGGASTIADDREQSHAFAMNAELVSSPPNLASTLWRSRRQRERFKPPNGRPLVRKVRSQLAVGHSPDVARPSSRLPVRRPFFGR